MKSKPRPPYEDGKGKFVRTPEMRAKQREAQKARWEAWRSAILIPEKTCKVCGKIFTRRNGEPVSLFLKRQKCRADCYSRTVLVLKVMGGHDVRRMNSRAAPKPDPVYSSRTHELVFYSRTWYSQNRHWLNKDDY